MNFDCKKIDNANYTINASIKYVDTEKTMKELAQKMAKDISIAGFRKGKTPSSLVLKKYKEQLIQDARNKLIEDVFKEALNKLKIDKNSLAGEPTFSKFEEKDNDLEIEVQLGIKPEIKLENYLNLVPNFTLKTIKTTDINNRIKEIAQAQAKNISIKTKRALKDKDLAIIDFEGFVDGKPFKGNKVQNHNLLIGSKSIIGDFEEKLIGMKINEEREIKVKFPDDYPSDELKGKDAVFKVQLKDIQEKEKIDINDDFAKKVLNDENAKLLTLEEKIKDILENEDKQNIYGGDLKDNFFKVLLKEYEFDMPNSLVEKEIDSLLNQKLSSMKEEELNILKEDKDKIQKLRDEFKEKAYANVKATFLIEALAKKEKIDVTNDELSKVIFNEALKSGKDPKKLLQEYQNAGYLPLIQMSIIEGKVLNKIFDSSIESKKSDKSSE